MYVCGPRPLKVGNVVPKLHFHVVLFHVSCFMFHVHTNYMYVIGMYVCMYVCKM